MKMCFCPQWPRRKLLLTKCLVKRLKWDEVAWTRQQPGVAASTWTASVLQPKSSLGRLGSTRQAMPGIPLTSKDTRNWGFGEMASAPAIWGRKKSEGEAHHHFKVQSRCLASPRGCPLRAPLLPVLSAVFLACLNLCPGVFLVHHMPPLRVQLLCSFQSFYCAPAQTVCMQGWKKLNWMRSFFSSHLRHSAC